MSVLNKINHKYGTLGAWIIILSFTVSSYSCGTAKEKNEPNAEEISKELKKEKKKALKKAKKAVQKLITKMD